MSLSPEDTLLFLCVHGTKHQWSRLAWIADVAELVRSSPDLDWGAVMSEAAALGARKMLQAGLVLAADLLGATVPDRVLRTAREDAAVTGLSGEIYTRYLAGSHKEFGGAAYFWFDVRIRDRFWQGLLYPLRMALSISVRDLEFVSLPQRLWPLYLFLRPVRLVRQYGAALWSRRRR